jgi:coenzyme F420-reducing hydrogenase beta subunit
MHETAHLDCARGHKRFCAAVSQRTCRLAVARIERLTARPCLPNRQDGGIAPALAWRALSHGLLEAGR